jgi:hypothetical protein
MSINQAQIAQIEIRIDIHKLRRNRFSVSPLLILFQGGINTMNFFEGELQKIFGSNASIADIRFAGRVCIGRLGQTTNVKLQFVTLGSADHYEAIQATVLNRSEGVIDTQIFRLKDILGKKQVNNPNFGDGYYPHIWSYGNKTEWPVYKPTAEDYKAIADTVNSYLEVFLDPTSDRPHEKTAESRREPAKKLGLMDEVRAEQEKINAAKLSGKSIPKHTNRER